MMANKRYAAKYIPRASSARWVEAIFRGEWRIAWLQNEDASGHWVRFNTEDHLPFHYVRRIRRPNWLEV